MVNTAIAHCDPLDQMTASQSSNGTIRMKERTELDRAIFTSPLSAPPLAITLLQLGSLGNTACFHLVFSSAALHELIGRDLKPQYGTAIGSTAPDLFDHVLLDRCMEAL